MSPFEIVYGFNPITPLDLSPLPLNDQSSQDGISKAELIKKIHQKAKENLEKKTEQYQRQANKNRKQMTFEPGDWVWLHMRPERFPQKRSSKLAPRGDGPFRVLEKINDNAYKLELPGEFNISSTFNVTDLAPFDAGEPVLRSKPSEEGGNDEDTAAIDPTQAPQVPNHPMTRSRTRKLQEAYNAFVEKASQLHSFSLLHGFIPQGFPGEVFNEAIASQSRQEDPSRTSQYHSQEEHTENALHLAQFGVVDAVSLFVIKADHDGSMGTL